MPAALVVAGLVMTLALPPGAGAAARTLHLRYGPVALGPAELKSRLARVPAPRVDGYVTRMHAVVTDARGQRVTSDQVMLHHAVFRRTITPRWDPDCSTRRDTEPFYATGEEDERLLLPAGYGLRVDRRQRWLVRWMLMNHTGRPWNVFIQYDVRVDTSHAIKPVIPVWMRVVSCREEYFDVPGGGGPGSVFAMSREIAMPRTGRIVAATGHLHGGAVGLALTQPSCGGRHLFTARPVYRSPATVAEGGPVHVARYASPIGIPVVAGERLGLTALYDNSVAHDDVMGTLHAYLARGRYSAVPCPPLS